MSDADGPHASPDPEISFCATNLNTGGTLKESLASVDRLGHAIGRPYEIVVADGPSEPEIRHRLVEWQRAGAGRVLVTQDERNRGKGRRLAFEASRGRWIVPFDTSIVYAPLFGQILRAFLEAGDERFLFSEICALPRAAIVEAGGWRDLIGGEDVDLYAPIVARRGIVAYPTGDPGSQSANLSSYARQMRYAGRSRFRRVLRMLRTQRDQMIGANYRIADLMAFNRRKPGPFRGMAYAWFVTAWFLTAFRGIPRRTVPGRNNYLYLREQTLLSMERGDHRRLGGTTAVPARLPLTEDERTYLDLRSAIWRRLSAEHPEWFPLKP